LRKAVNSLKGLTKKPRILKLIGVGATEVEYKERMKEYYGKLDESYKRGFSSFE
jgi:hypothetical protein